MLRQWIVLLVFGLLLCAQGIEASQVVRRFVLAVGANDGGAKRETLQYAVSDAQNFVQVMETMGGVDAGVLLSDPRIDHLEEALHALHNRVASAEAARREVIIYYSGHADENGLLLAREIQAATASVELTMGQREILGEDHFEIIVREHTTTRGGIKYSVKRSRIELRGGYWNPGGDSTTNTGGLVRQSVGSGLLRQSVENLMGSIAYTYQLNENLALMVRWAGLIAEVEQNVGVIGTSQSVVIVMPLLFGVRYYWPLAPSPFRPYVVASAGPYFLQDVWQDDSGIWQYDREEDDEDEEEDDEEDRGQLVQEVRAQASLGTYIGGGIDFAIGRYLMFGASAGYHLIANFAEPVRSRKNFSGPELSISLSLLWGKDVGTAKSIRR